MEVKRLTGKLAEKEKLLTETRRKLAEAEGRARYATGLRNAALDLAGAMRAIAKDMRDHITGADDIGGDDVVTETLVARFDNLSGLDRSTVLVDALRRFMTAAESGEAFVTVLHAMDPEIRSTVQDILNSITEAPTPYLKE